MFDSEQASVNPRTRAWLTIRQAMAATLAPPVCALCGANGQRIDEPWGLDLCSSCEQACDPAPEEILPFDAVFCPYRYQHPVDLMITRLKFQHELVFARVLGMQFARAWRAAGRAKPACLVPMPLHRERYRERGFCQTTEIARHLAPRLRGAAGRGLPIRTDLLQRIRSTPAQSGLSAGERAMNLRDAFAVPAGRDPPRHVALLDDVMTTGHTALAAARALRSAGVERVEIWCCARALRAGAPWP
jgi:ComF family protein